MASPLEIIMNEIGAFGLYQRLMTLLIGLASALAATTFFSTIFTTAAPNMVCHNNSTLANVTTNATMSMKEKCAIWNNSSSSCKFDRTYYDHTIVTDWKLVCDRLYLAALTQTIFMFGSSSSMFTGGLSDKFGRRPVVIGILWITIMSILFSQIIQLEALGLSVHTRYLVYSVSQYVNGLSSYVGYVTAYVLVVELTTAKYTTLVSIIYLAFNVAGQLLCMVLYYILRSWIAVNWILLVLFILYAIVVQFCLPESPRFLITTKRYEDAYESLLRVAQLNNKTNERLHTFKNFKMVVGSVSQIARSRFFDESDTGASRPSRAGASTLRLDPIDEANVAMMSKSSLSVRALEEIDQRTKKKTLGQYLTTRTSLTQFIIMAYVWVSLILTFYGLSLGITSTGRFDPYIMFTLSSLAELVGCLLCIFNDRIGQKRTIVVYFLVSSLMCLAVMLTPKNSNQPVNTGKVKSLINISTSSLMIISFSLFGKIMAAAAFNSSYIYTSQMFPTNLRGNLMTLTTSIGRVGSLLAPQINLLGVIVWAELPYLIFSVCSFIASIFLIILPDPATLNYI